MIHVADLVKTFRVHKKEPGLKGSLSSLVRRNWIEKKALKGVSLDVEAGEILGLIGANGAGKTTLVKCLAGIIHPTSGNVEVLGFKPWEKANEFRRQIALIMGQKAQLWWDLPAADCFLLLREIYQIPKRRFGENLDFLAKTLDVEDQLKVQVRRLSLGERMKMELIAALLHDPRVVYLDEPTIGLDLNAQRAIRGFLLEYMSRHEPAMILTSHYMEDIESLCKRIVIIKDGEIIYDGSLAEVVRRYARHKVIGITLRSGDDRGAVTSMDTEGELWRTLGLSAERTNDLSLVSVSETAIRIRVPRQDVPAFASRALERLAVVDLSIEEEDIGTIIASIMGEG